MKRTIGYAISDNNNFNKWSYNKYSIYYLAKIVEEYDKNTGECKNRYFEELDPKFAYRDKKIEIFRNLKVYDKDKIALNLNGCFIDFSEKKVKNSFKIDGLKGKWYILDSQEIKDKNGISKKVLMIESEIYGEEAITYIDENYNWFKQFDDFENFKEIEQYMADINWEEFK